MADSNTTELEPLYEAVDELSECLRSAFNIVQREGIHDTVGTTSWNLAADRFSKILHKHHATINAVRAARGTGVQIP
jgi:hypothetical protein